MAKVRKQPGNGRRPPTRKQNRIPKTYDWSAQIHPNSHAICRKVTVVCTVELRFPAERPPMRHVKMCLRRRVLLDNALDPPLVLDFVLFEQVVGLGLGRRLGVRVVKQILDSQEDLLDRNGGAPCLFLVENGQADGTGGVHVGVKEGGDKFACEVSCMLVS
jgi:hypothetical protein